MLQVISAVVLIVAPMLLYWMYNPPDKQTYSRNNTDIERSEVDKKEEDDEKNRKTHEIEVESLKGWYIL